MRLPAFAYESPRDLDEALELLKTYGPECKILAGGTDLLVRMKQGLTSPAHLISLKALPALTNIREADGALLIGAAVRLADILTYKPIQDRWPGLFEAVNAIGAPSIQHFAGTIGGNLSRTTAANSSISRNSSVGPGRPVTKPVEKRVSPGRADRTDAIQFASRMRRRC